jgi:hypothetical protein
MAAITRATGGNTITTAVPPTTSRIPGHVAGETLEAGDVVYIKAADGRLWKASAINSEAQYAVGIAGEAASAGQAVTLLRNISIGYGTGLTPGAKVFVSASSAGNIDSALTATYAPTPIGFVLGDGKRIFFHF